MLKCVRTRVEFSRNLTLVKYWKILKLNIVALIILCFTIFIFSCEAEFHGLCSGGVGITVDGRGKICTYKNILSKSSLWLKTSNYSHNGH